MDLPGEEEEAMSVESIRMALQAAWPSIDTSTVTFPMGSTVKATVWQFTTEVTLTTNPVVFTEKVGNARMVFTFHPQGLKSVQLKAGVATQMAVVKAFIRSCKMYMNGIVAAIERAGEERPPAPEADIFRIR
jgi:cell division protein FtsI/penicillin-binding protein 2